MLALKKRKGKSDDLDFDGFNFDDQDLAADLDEVEDLSAIGGPVGGGGAADEIMDKLSEIETKMSRLDSSVHRLNNEMESMRGEMGDTEENIKKLLSVYEVVSKKFNPFIDVEGGSGGPGAEAFAGDEGGFSGDADFPFDLDGGGDSSLPFELEGGGDGDSFMDDFFGGDDDELGGIDTDLEIGEPGEGDGLEGLEEGDLGEPGEAPLDGDDPVEGTSEDQPAAAGSAMAGPGAQSSGIPDVIAKQFPGIDLMAGLREAAAVPVAKKPAPQPTKPTRSENMTMPPARRAHDSRNDEMDSHRRYRDEDEYEGRMRSRRHDDRRRRDHGYHDDRDMDWERMERQRFEDDIRRRRMERDSRRRDYDFDRRYEDDYHHDDSPRSRFPRDDFDRRPAYKDHDHVMTYDEYEQRRRNWERDSMERLDKRGRRRKALSQPILTHVRPDYTTTVLVLRWIEFMFERVKRDKISLLLDYYKDCGWISDEVKAQVMSYARGEIQDVTSYEPEEDLLALDKEGDFPQDYKKVEDWRLSAEDHLKSLLFIEKIAGRVVNKDSLNSLEQEISKFKRNLEGYHGV